ncbi:MAG: hypothetical protein M3392_13510 [Actinomycetota bacterium]|jgi:hypothetical protein|nr:hypothetical protein [Actinomycetota bacterium]
MSRRAAAWLAWAACALCVTPLAVSGVLLLLNGPSEGGTSTWGTEYNNFIFPVVVLAFALVGALVASRLPTNPIGWICLTIGLTAMLGSAAAEYGVYALPNQAGSLPGGEYAAWLGNWLWIPAVGLMGTFTILLFPTGRLPSRRWRVVAWLSGAVLVLASLSEAFSPGKLAEAPNVTNPLGIEAARGALELVNTAAFLLLPLCFVLSALSMVVRFRRSAGEERQQLKWFAAAAVLLGACFPFVFVVPSRLVQDLVTLLFAGLPMAIGVAILRYRLYDIDLLINRALVYGPLTAILALVYFGGVVGLQAAFRALSGQESTLAVVASTLAIAALFNPLRRWVQGFVDRRFYRRKYDAKKVLEAFNSRLREETDLDALAEDLVGVARSTIQPEHVGLWVRPEATPGTAQAD